MVDEKANRLNFVKGEARYANFFKTGYNAFEYVVDFGQYYSDDDDVEIHTRIITTPMYAKSLLRVLQESIDQYEASFGPIDEE